MSNPPIGYFKYCLAIDCETTGLAKGEIDPTLCSKTGKYYQAISFGVVILETETLKEIESLYVEIKWDGKSEWSIEAENIHGLSKKYLEENGVDEEDAVGMIGELILKYFDPSKTIPLLGHNVATFDRYFLDRLFKKYGIYLNFGARHIDSSTIGFTLFNLFHSDQIFQKIGLQDRGKHNSLEDIRHTIEVVRTARTLWEAFVTPNIV